MRPKLLEVPSISAFNFAGRLIVSVAQPLKSARNTNSVFKSLLVNSARVHTRNADLATTSFDS